MAAAVWVGAAAIVRTLVGRFGMKTGVAVATMADSEYSV